MTQFRYTVGDWSCAGHNMSEDFIFGTDSSMTDVYAAIKTLKENFPEWDSLCEDYQDTSVTPAIEQMFKDFGLDMSGRELEYFFDGADDYADTWAFLMNKFTPGLELERVPESKMPTIHGGGYGLFSD